MTKRKIPNHYRGRRYAKKRWPRTFAVGEDTATPWGKQLAAQRFIEAITLAYCAGMKAGIDEACRYGA